MADARDSVHFEPFPEASPERTDDGLGPAMELVKRIVDLGRAARGLKNVKTRQPLAKAVINGPEPLVEGLLSIIRSELNVKELSFEKDLSGYFERTAEVDPKKLGPRLRAAAGPVKEELLKLDPRELAQRSAEGPIDVVIGGTTYQIGKEDLRFHEVLPDRWAIGSDGDLEVLLDLEITDELWEEGIAREVVRRVQTMRKDMDLPYDAHIMVTMDGEKGLISAVEHFQGYIISETLTDSLVFGPTSSGTEWDLDDGKVIIEIMVA